MNSERPPRDKIRIDRRQLLRCSSVGLCARLVPFGRANADDKLPSANERIQQLAEDAPLSMQFNGTTAEHCRAWQQDFGRTLRTLLGPHDCPANWETTVERTVDCGDHIREELLLQAPGVPTLPVCRLLPTDSSAKPRPAVVAVHGHGANGYDAVVGRGDAPEILQQIREKDYDYGRQLVRRGYVVVAPCLTPFGRRLGSRELYKSNDPCAITFIRLQVLGKLLMAENLRDIVWSVELLTRTDQVDRDRIGCYGTLLRWTNDDAGHRRRATDQVCGDCRSAKCDAGADRFEAVQRRLSDHSRSVEVWRRSRDCQPHRSATRAMGRR